MIRSFSVLPLIVALCSSLFYLPAEAQEADVAAPPSLQVDFQPVFGGQEFKLPIFLTHANDGSDRIFVMGQLGTVEVLENAEDESPETFMDITDRVYYNKNENEQGLLGIAFHPRFEENGQLFAYYSARPTEQDERRRSVVSRFAVVDGKVDPDSESVLMTVEQPYWNHNGGTIVFGPDGMLYIALGDGGLFNDPHGNGQNPKTLLGSVLRIDVDSSGATTDGERRAYGIPQDNPFVGKESEGRPEVWAYGLRNVWRMAFDRETGKLWAGDVGQDVWEEVDILKAGGNYGWNLREGKHPFKNPKKEKTSAESAASADSKTDARGNEMIDPIFDYNHSEGKSITGGHVYRGKELPQLVGMYLYADYITGRIYTLEQRDGEWTEHVLRDKGLPITSFGEDAHGESYFMQSDGVISRLVNAEE